MIFFFFSVLPFLHCHVDLEYIHASAVLDHSRKNRSSLELWYVLSLSLPLSVLFLPLCCWLGSVLGSTCPQNEYTFACIRTLPWLAFYPLRRRVWLMIRVCHFSQQPSRPPACSHIKHPNAGENVEFHLLHKKEKNNNHMLAYHADTQEYNI